MPFEGFPEDGLSFLARLARHNERDWFEAHRAVWDNQIVPAMLSWCAELCEELRDVMPRLVFVPRVGCSHYRLNRDIRFSRGKSPYKTHVAALLWEGGDKHDAPGVYVRVSPSEVLFAGGMWMFEQEGRLDRYRKRLQDDDSAQRLESSLSHARKAGLKVAAAEQLQRPPRPFTPDHPRAELSRYKGVTVGKESSPGAWLHSREALRRSLAVARADAPLHAWLRDEICA